jgi:hypothetical protein
MKPTFTALILAVFSGAWSVVATAQAPEALPAISVSRPEYSLTLGGRSACVTPSHRGQSRAEGGQIDVTSPNSNALAAVLSGSVAANAYLGCPGSAAERFQLVQEFEITCSDKNIKTAKMSLDSVLAGFVRSKHRSGAGTRLATAKICPVGSSQPVMVITHPTLAVEGTDGRHCNQNLPTLEVSGLPLGSYTITAEFVLEAQAFGIADAHSHADFSPSGSLPSDWVRTRDPFQGVDKKNFGFSFILTVAADEATTISGRRNQTSGVRQASVVMPTQAASRARQISINEKGFGRLSKP